MSGRTGYVDASMTAAYVSISNTLGISLNIFIIIHECTDLREDSLLQEVVRLKCI